MEGSCLQIFATLLLLYAIVPSIPASGTDFPLSSAHECLVTHTHRRVNGFAPYYTKQIKCKHFEFTNATCSSTCRDPRTGKLLSKKKYRPDPISCVQTFDSRIEGKIELSVTISCR
uniref:uncharacterized protein LOC120338096 n=1 Tax=Styela clava TaxID=7725 RepID=UPI00193AC2BC|nr:uncharacterized protein LOC120338096 [Styela clava]